ncbi:hypothetical protein HHI36_022787 [Cryptolaemus montrouzieri]|uniref:Phospholipid scramblase n=1 Tax=Cryptolaemus montrouzieri TaxID=559131 RepID=A0ABD2PED1_9CUCU
MFPEIHIITFLEHSNDYSTISHQPLADRDEERRLRRSIPISTIDWQSTTSSHFIPLSGLDFLSDVENVIIQQCVELSDVISNIPSENRYTVKVPRGETIYYASENSDLYQRNLFGSSRAFQMHLHDPTQQLALTLKKNLACGTCWTCCCLQVIEVYSAMGEYIGSTQQKRHVTKPLFSVNDKFHNTVYKIKGPTKILCCSPEYFNFQIYASDGLTQIGSIVHQWDSVQVSYNTILQFPNRRIDNKLKSLLLGAAFLIEYMYFENARKVSCKCFC